MQNGSTLKATVATAIEVHWTAPKKGTRLTIVSSPVAQAMVAPCFRRRRRRWMIAYACKLLSKMRVLAGLVAQDTSCTSQARTRALMSVSCGWGVIGSRR